MIRFLRSISIIGVILAALLYAGVSFYTGGKNDKTGPDIHMKKDSITVSVDASEADLLQGITAEDKKDGDVTDSLVVEKTGNLVGGKRKITVAAFDSNHHVTRKTRTIQYSDYQSPRITIQSSLRVPAGKMSQLVDGISVQDCLDGDITSNLQITMDRASDSEDTPGEYQITLAVSNSAGDMVTIPATVEVYDTAQEASRPQIELKQYLAYTTVGKKIDPKTYLKTIRVDGETYAAGGGADEEGEGSSNGKSLSDLGDSLKIDTSQVSYQKAGVYEIVYSVENASQNTGTGRLIVVVEEKKGGK